MNKSHILMLASFLILVIFLSGCNQSGGGAGTNVMKGTSGVEAKFLNPQQQLTLYDGQSFPLLVQVSNEGTSDTTATLILSGIDTNILKTSTSKSIKLKGKSTYNPRGDLSQAEFDITPSLPSDADNFNSNVNLYLCYPYTTSSTFSVCVSNNPLANKKPGECDPNQPLSISGGQGAPVAVTQITQTPGKGLTTLGITIKNVGGGTVIKQDKVGSCLDASEIDENWVHLDEASMSRDKIECKPEDIYLNDGVGYLTCTVRLANDVQGAYTTPLNLKFSYGYMKMEGSKNINVIKPLR